MSRSHAKFSKRERVGGDGYRQIRSLTVGDWFGVWAVRKTKTWIVWSVAVDDSAVVPVDHCHSLIEAMHSRLPGIVHEYDFVAGDDEHCGTFLNDRVIGVNRALRARLH